MGYEPSTLQEAIRYFADAENCLNYLAARRWPDGVVTCPTCGRKNPHYNAERKVWVCSLKHEKRQFSVKLGTIFEDSPLGLDKWLPAVWLLANCKNGISSFEIGRDLGVTQKTAWFMLSRIRLGLQSEDGGKLAGEIEADESFIGGKARNMHADVKARKITGRGPEGKAIVAAVLQRGGKVRAKVVDTLLTAEMSTSASIFAGVPSKPFSKQTSSPLSCTLGGTTVCSPIDPSDDNSRNSIRVLWSSGS